MTAGDPRVWFAVLMERSIEQFAAQAMMNLCMDAGFRSYRRIALPYTRTDRARNEIVTHFLSEASEPDDALIMLDADHAHPPDTISRLVAHQEKNGERVGVVAALAFRRGEPYEPCCFLRAPSGNLVQPLEWKPGLSKVTMTGTGAICIRRWVFDQLEEKMVLPPWFRYSYTDGKPTALPSEDMYFGHACEAAGIPHFVDFSLVTPHLITTSVDESTFRDYVADHPEQFGPAVERRESVAPKVSVILPTRGRPAQAHSCIRRLFETTQPVEVIVVTDDPDTLAVLHSEMEGLVTIVEAGGTAVDKWNIGAARAHGEWLVPASDDIYWHDGWLDRALATPNRGFIGLNDGHANGFAPFFMMTRDWARTHHGGVLAIPHYRSWYTDVETGARAHRADSFVLTREQVLEHRHPVWNTAPEDATYALGAQWHEADKRTLERRQAAGFPDDFEPMIHDAPAGEEELNRVG